jgi:hypothetical protein
MSLNETPPFRERHWTITIIMSDHTSRHDHDIILLKPQVDEQQRLLDSRKERIPVPLHLSFILLSPAIHSF